MNKIFNKGGFFIVSIGFLDVLTAFGILVAMIIGLLKFWDRFIKWWSNITGGELDLKKLPSDSPLKKEFKNIDKKIESMGSRLDTILSVQNDMREDNNKFKASLLELEIKRAIDHDLGKVEVLKLYNVYKELPQDTNSFVSWIVNNYTNPKAHIDINDYYATNIKSKDVSNL